MLLHTPRDLYGGLDRICTHTACFGDRPCSDISQPEMVGKAGIEPAIRGSQPPGLPLTYFPFTILNFFTQKNSERGTRTLQHRVMGPTVYQLAYLAILNLKRTTGRNRTCVVFLTRKAQNQHLLRWHKVQATSENNCECVAIVYATFSYL